MLLNKHRTHSIEVKSIFCGILMFAKCLSSVGYERKFFEIERAERKTFELSQARAEDPSSSFEHEQNQASVSHFSSMIFSFNFE